MDASEHAPSPSPTRARRAWDALLPYLPPRPTVVMLGPPLKALAFVVTAAAALFQYSQTNAIRRAEFSLAQHRQYTDQPWRDATSKVGLTLRARLVQLSEATECAWLVARGEIGLNCAELEDEARARMNLVLEALGEEEALDLARRTEAAAAHAPDLFDSAAEALVFSEELRRRLSYLNAVSTCVAAGTCDGPIIMDLFRVDMVLLLNTTCLVAGEDDVLRHLSVQVANFIRAQDAARPRPSTARPTFLCSWLRAT